MDEWEDIDENEREEEEEEEMILDYCAQCDEPIYDGDEYTVLDDGRILCESCAANLIHEQ